MEHRQNQWALFFAHGVKHIVMLDSGDEQFRPVFENRPRPDFPPADGLEMALENYFVTAGLLNSPSGDCVSGDGADILRGWLSQLIKRHVICPCVRDTRF